MITRDEIRSIPELHKSIERDKEQLRYLREKATALPPTLTGQERVQTSPSNSSMHYVDEATDLNREILQKETELLELQTRAKAFIDTLDKPLARKVMRFRYLRCMKWEEIADLMGYAEGYLRQIESDATKELLPPAPTYGI